MKSHHALLLASFALLVTGCSSSEPASPTDASLDAPKDSKICCKISSAPACCMFYGGSPDETGSCHDEGAGICDFLPDPSSPLWQKKVDENGCPYWHAPKEIPPGCNPWADAGGPDGTDDASDASLPIDAPDGAGGG